MVLIVVALALLFSLAAAALFFLKRGVALRGTLPVTPEWIDELSPTRYRPMLRLLDETDLKSLRSQPGYNKHLESKLRAQRSRIFRGYLRALDADFKRVTTTLRLVMMSSHHDRPDLATALLKSQLSFATGLVLVHLRLTLYHFGLGSVDVRNLVTCFDGMRAELRTLMPAALPIAA